MWGIHSTDGIDSAITANGALPPATPGELRGLCSVKGATRVAAFFRWRETSRSGTSLEAGSGWVVAKDELGREWLLVGMDFLLG